MRNADEVTKITYYFLLLKLLSDNTTKFQYDKIKRILENFHDGIITEDMEGCNSKQFPNGNEKKYIEGAKFCEVRGDSQEDKMTNAIMDMINEEVAKQISKFNSKQIQYRDTLIVILNEVILKFKDQLYQTIIDEREHAIRKFEKRAGKEQGGEESESEETPINYWNISLDEWTRLKKKIIEDYFVDHYCEANECQFFTQIDLDTIKEKVDTIKDISEMSDDEIIVITRLITQLPIIEISINYFMDKIDQIAQFLQSQQAQQAQQEQLSVGPVATTRN